MNSKLLFLSNFLRKPKEIASIAPSSKHVIRQIIKNIDFNEAKTIVEYGPGIGTITKQILEKLHPDAKLICFETNKKFCNFLKENIKDSRLVVINDTAEKLDFHLNKFNIKNIDYILSGIPFSFIKKENKKIIIKKTKESLKRDGKFIVYQQYNLHLRRYLDIYFNIVFMDLELRNIPPTFIFICEKHEN